MIYSADLREMAGKISHVNVSKYLRDLDWVFVPTKRKNVEVFQHDKNGIFLQVDLPVSTELRDYKLAMYNAIENIAQAYDKNVEQVILELLNPFSDILRLKIKEPDLDAGSILFEDAINLYDNAKKLLSASARDIISPKLCHTGRAENVIEEFINHCRFGQTEIGSYVVSIACPISIISNNQCVQLSLFGKADEAANSITRRVVNKLITSVRDVKESINRGNLDEFIHGAAKTKNCISTNFLEALSGINIYRKDSFLDIAIQYAPTIQKNRIDDVSVSIDHNYYDPINTFVSSVKISRPQEGNRSFVGRVKKLSATPDAKIRDGGDIAIVFLNEEEKKVTASAHLAKEDYNVAIEAHKAGKNVKIVGLLKSRKIIECSSFEILD